ncbi:MAG: ketopantoate reductase family protein [Gammaproteobacteria bacterium]|nr:ketopantoate reductase family protein [Gammaproteobacteria bacterium]
MRFIVFGAGGVGGSIGARLHLKKYDVVFIARGTHGEILQSDGLRFVSPAHDVRVQVPTVLHPRDVDWRDEDVVLLCVKSQQTEAALGDLRAASHDAVPVICCQNGVANESMALRNFSHVYAMCVMLPAEHLEPGTVISFADSAAGSLNLGRFPSGTDETANAVTAALRDAGFLSEADATVMRFKYAKLLMNLGNGVQAACGEWSHDIGETLKNEALTVLEAEGIDVATFEDLESIRKFNRGVPMQGFKRHGGSSLQSILRATGNIEVDYLNGEIVALGRKHGIPTPANLAVQRVALAASAANKAGTYCSLEDLRKMMARG